MVVFAVSGAIVLAFVCWVMLRESPPSTRASALQDGMDPGAQAVDHDAGDRCPNAVDHGGHEAGAQAADEDAAYADELEPPVTRASLPPGERDVRAAHGVQPPREVRRVHRHSRCAQPETSTLP